MGNQQQEASYGCCAPSATSWYQDRDHYQKDGLQVISTLNPQESPSRQTLRGKNFTSDWIHWQRIMSSHLESEIVQSSGKVLQWSLCQVNIFPEACGIEATTEAVTVHVEYCFLCSVTGILSTKYTIT